MDQKTNGADPEGCAVVITLYRHYNTKLRVNGTFSRKYIWKRINELSKKIWQKGLTRILSLGWTAFAWEVPGKIKGKGNPKIKGNSKGNSNPKVKSVGQECPTHTSNTKINSKGKGDGQECPAYTDMDTGFLLIWILA
jgi:hypothetical protein